MNYTPGPWLEISLANGELAIVDSSTSMVCILPDVDSYKDALTRDATSTLIAAAPDLLEALKGLVAYTDFGDDCGAVGCDYCQTCRPARAAIARAEGK